MADELANAFVAGATGHTGRNLVEVLRAQGHQVVAHVRPDSPELPRWKEEFGALGAQVDATPWELEALTSTLRQLKPTHVFALIGTTRRRAGALSMSAQEAYDRIDRGLSTMLMDAASATGSPRFIYLSALGVRPQSRNAYHRARLAAEAHLRTSGLPFVIVRPSWISGDRAEVRLGERVGAAISDAMLALGGALGARGLQARYRSITGRGLAEELARIALDGQVADTVIEAEALHR